MAARKTRQKRKKKPVRKPSKPPKKRPSQPVKVEGGRPWISTEDRRATVERLKLRGYSNKEIAAHLQVSPKTIEADWTIIRKERISQWRQKSGDDVLVELQGMIEENRREWAELKAAATTTQEKMGCLFGFLKAVDRLLKLYQIGGKVSPDTVKVEVSEIYRASIMEAIKDVPEEVAEKFLDSLEQFALTKGDSGSPNFTR
jgi:transposase